MTEAPARCGAVELLDGDPLLVHVLVEVVQDDREPYQLLWASEQPPEHLEHAGSARSADRMATRRPATPS